MAPSAACALGGVVGVNTDGLTAAIDAQRRSWEIMAEAVEKAGISPERFVDLLTVGVGQTDSEVVYEENKLRLHRYEPAQQRHETPIFVVYALVNRPYILDLQPDRSVIRRLLEAGFVVYLVDWGEPSVLDRSLTMDDYVNRYIDNCVDAIRADAGVDDVHLMGYCMGGTMSIMYATQYPDAVRTLTLMATPFSFDGEGGILERWATHYDADATVDALGNVPAELLAMEFSLMDPIDQYITKYVRLYENLEDEEFVRNFARMEQWIWDGVDVAGEVYREFITEIYQDNRLVRGEYYIGDDRIDVSEIEMPVQQIVGEYDHIVPPESSKPLNDQVSSADERLIEFSAGHIGISVSGGAHANLWPDVCDWLADRDATEAGPTADDGADATGDSVTNTNGHAPDIETIRGIGPTYADRLHEAGIDTVADLAEYDPEQLAEIADAAASRTAYWIDQAA